jgi:amino acid adenylation domain-containing protein
VCGDLSLTYGELNARSNRLAHALRRLGVRRDVLVAVCLDRSIELVVALLAVLKAGGAYVPLETTHPADRIAFVLDDAKVAVVLTDASQLDKVSRTQAPIVRLDQADFRDESDTNLDESGLLPGDPQDALAYVIYTSGSTGKPKGCLIDHRNVVRLFEATGDWFTFSDRDVWTLFHSVAFDFSVWEIWGALVYGGKLVVVPYLVSRSPEEFYRLLSAERVTVLNQTPSAFRQLIAVEGELGISADLALRLVIFGGEALEFESLRPWFDAHGDEVPRLVNMYGITETTVHVTYRPVSLADLGSTSASVIGRPIPDLQVYLLDPSQQLVPVGVPGEIYVGGAGVARGYLDRPELTAERFLDSPFRPGTRLYRSGDLARFLPNGELDYLGRIDQQVKIRGFRIETGEVEAVLRRTGLVRDATVVPYAPSKGETLLCAYVVTDVSPQDLRALVREKLPEYMVPSAFVVLGAIPMTSNGKVDRRALPAPEEARRVAIGGPPETEIEQTVAKVWRAVLGRSHFGRDDNFFDLGGTSLRVVEVAAKLRLAHGLAVPVAMLFQHATVRALAEYIVSMEAEPHYDEAEARGKRARGASAEAIAIVGLAARFPGAADADEYWSNLCAGVESVTFFDPRDLDPAERAQPGYVAARGILTDAETFDASFFAIPPREAEVIDPQQRVMLEIAWETLQSAGVDPSAFPGSIGVYCGEYNDTYYTRNILPRPDVIERVGAFQAMAGNEKDFIATRIAHKLNLKGPALSIHTGCSTSLVAVANAFYALRTHQCDLALAGGVAITVPQRAGHVYQEGGMLSADGHTRPFDASATGTVFSDGAGMVALRRLSDALASGDRIWAVVRGAATNNDGAEKMSFTAPSVEGQAEVITTAMAVAEVSPDTISYVEAHGTATPLGDPIEIEGLTRAFRAHTSKKRYCGVGSVKGNFGHLTAASGVAGLIKTAYALDRKLIPPSLHFEKANPKIDFEASPFFVVTQATPWKPGPTPRRAGVSSFGVGGTNAHVVLEEAPPLASRPEPKPAQLLVLSAKTRGALDLSVGRLREHLRREPELDLADAAYTLQVGRRVFAHRCFVVGGDTQGTVQALASPLRSGQHDGASPEVVFLFPGQGSQYLHMGSRLAACEPVFRDALGACAEIVRPWLGFDLLDALDPKGADEETAATRLRQTSLTQPALFSISYALARLYESWAIRPAVMAGHSVGEFVAACLSGVMGLEDALSLVAARGKLMQELPRGSMLSVRASADRMAPRLGDRLVLAAINAPSLVVVAGPDDAIDALEASLGQDGVVSSRLHTSHAFHSAMMDPIVEPFAERVRAIRLRPPRIPFVSTVTARLITDQEATDPMYWAKHLRQTVRFADAVRELASVPNRVLLEVGPRSTLTTFARQSIQSPQQLAVASLEATAETEWSSLLRAVGQLWLAGVTVDWPAMHEGALRRRVALPATPFERKRYWIDPVPRETAPVRREAQEDPMTPQAPLSTARRGRIVDAIKKTFEDASGIELAAADASATFVELGLDSLVLTQCAQKLQGAMGVRVALRQLMEDQATLAALAEYLDTSLPPDAFAERAPAPAPLPAAAAPSLGFPVVLAAGSNSAVEALVAQQLQIMARQLELLGARPVDSPVARTPAAVAAVAAAAPEAPEAGAKPFGAQVRIERTRGPALAEPLRTALDVFAQRYLARTPRSKAFTQDNRARLADPRVVTGFKPIWKEIVYPIVVERSSGSKLWDIDGHEYIDLTCGFGANFLGHRPPYVVEAVHAQLDRGFEIGPQHPLVAETSALLAELTGHERVVFCNTGSEAVLGATRIARTVTGKNKIVTFTGDYHGIFDEVVLRGSRSLKSFPGAPGITPEAVANNLVLEYGAKGSLEVIASRAGEIAAVLVEPVQSRHPDLQPREFLQELRVLTERLGIALIFDEVITGFRIRLGGAQEYFGVKADLATYGKILGGGLPIGAIAGKRAFMDALDGGMWQYGDASVPEVGVTYFAGTFVRHPLALAAAKAALEFVKRESPGLQERLNAKTEALVQRLNDFFKNVGVPFSAAHFSSFFKLSYPDDLEFAGLLYYWMRSKGIHIWDGRVCFLTVAHTDEDIAAILRAFEESVVEMQDTGFLPRAALPPPGPDAPPVPGARLGRDPLGRPAWFVADPKRPGKYLRVGAT